VIRSVEWFLGCSEFFERATVAAAVGECSRNLTGVDERIRELLHGARTLHVDETGMRVNGNQHWFYLCGVEGAEREDPLRKLGDGSGAPSPCDPRVL
jgi:hypothetical protein